MAQVQQTIQRYRAAHSEIVIAVSALTLSRNIIDIATQIRSDYGLKTPDALQAACCLSLQSQHIFLTEDHAFNKVGKLKVSKVITS